MFAKVRISEKKTKRILSFLARIATLTPLGGRTEEGLARR